MLLGTLPLSLARIRVGNNLRLPPKRIAQLSRLTSLLLTNDPEVVGYILGHVDVPAVASLEIPTRVSGGDVARAFGLFFPDDRLQKRLFSDP